MNIAYLMGTSTSDALEAVYGEKKKRAQDEEEEALRVSSWKPDTVTLSAEAKAFAAALENQKTDGYGSNQQGTNTAADQQKDAQESGALGSSGGGVSMGGSIASVEAKIKQIQQKINEIQKSNIPDEAKESLIAGLLEQLNAAMQELNELKAQSSAG